MIPLLSILLVLIGSNLVYMEYVLKAMSARIAELEARLDSAKSELAELRSNSYTPERSLSDGGGRPSSAGYVLNAMKDRIAELKAKALELEGVRARSCDPSPEEKEIMRIIDEKY